MEREVMVVVVLVVVAGWGEKNEVQEGAERETE